MQAFSEPWLQQYFDARYWYKPVTNTIQVALRVEEKTY